MIVERKIIHQTPENIKGALERIQMNIAISQERFKDTELVASYEQLRMDYIKRLALWYNEGKPIEPIRDVKLAPALFSLEFPFEVKESGRNVTALIPFNYKPYNWAQIYIHTGREFLIEGHKVIFKKKY